MPKKRIEPAVKDLIRKMPLELTCQKISELTGISMATIRGTEPIRAKSAVQKGLLH